MVSNSDRRSSSSASPRERAQVRGRARREPEGGSRPARQTRPAREAAAYPEGDLYPSERTGYPRAAADAGFEGRRPCPSGGDAARTTRPEGRRGAAMPQNKSFTRRKRLFVCTMVAVCALFLTYVVCVWSPLFQIKRIVVMPTQRVSDQTVSDLAAIPAGSTLFGFDEAGVEKRLLANPWIESVRLTRNVPDTLTVEVQERDVAAVVMLSNGQAAWRLSSDGVWIEPVELALVSADNGVEAYDVQAKDAAASDGVVYVSEVAATVNPEAGAECTDEGLLGLLAYIEGFTPALLDQVASACAPSKEAIAVVLTNGIKVSLGAPDDIALKEQTVLGILDKFAGQISYVNVRVPASPTYRGLTGDAAAAAGDAGASDALPYQAQEGSADAGADASADSAAGSDASASDTAQDASADGRDDGSVAASTTDVPDDAAYNGGYYLPDGQTWVNYYYGSDGSLVHGYYDADDNWVDMG